MSEKDIEKITDETMQSLDGIKRAGPKPFLFTRVMAAINNNAAVSTVWTRAAAFISKPAVAFVCLLLVMFLNAAILFISKNNSDVGAMIQNNSIAKDEFATNTVTIYDLENLDQ